VSFELEGKPRGRVFDAGQARPKTRLKPGRRRGMLVG
jgi:hypothetical protein